MKNTKKTSRYMRNAKTTIVVLTIVLALIIFMLGTLGWIIAIPALAYLGSKHIGSRFWLLSLIPSAIATAFLWALHGNLLNPHAFIGYQVAMGVLWLTGGIFGGTFLHQVWTGTRPNGG